MHRPYPYPIDWRQHYRYVFGQAPVDDPSIMSFPDQPPIAQAPSAGITPASAQAIAMGYTLVTGSLESGSQDTADRFNGQLTPLLQAAGFRVVVTKSPTAYSGVWGTLFGQKSSFEVGLARLDGAPVPEQDAKDAVAAALAQINLNYSALSATAGAFTAQVVQPTAATIEHGAEAAASSATSALPWLSIAIVGAAAIYGLSMLRPFLPKGRS
jgi:hypothetical protein